MVNWADPWTRLSNDRYETYYANNGAADDYAVLKLLANEVTGKLPGEVQGHYDVSFERVKIGDVILLLAMGKMLDLTVTTLNKRIASIVSLSQSLWHNIDTRFGNSGSVIIDQVTKNYWDSYPWRLLL